MGSSSGGSGSWRLVPLLVGTAATLCALAASPATEPTTRGAKVRLVLVGDSTVTEKEGWGLGFKELVAADLDLINMARGGRSSRSYFNEGHWAEVLKLKPDYLILQFGHNDCPGKGPERETDPNTTFYENMARYVEQARSIGAKPILVTSLTRRRFREDGKIHSDLTAYADAVKRLAAEKNVPLIDLHARSIEYFNQLGADAWQKLAPLNKEGKPDGTHLNPDGSRAVAKLVAEDLRASVPQLAGYIKGPSLNEVTVAADGSGDFKTVRAAIDSVPKENDQRIVIHIKPGTYKEHIVLPKGKNAITFRGDDATTTILTDDRNVNFVYPDGKKITTPDSSSTLVRGEDFIAENITFQNTAGNHGQALAMYHDADRGIFRRCRFLGWQDTLRVNRGRSYFVDCYIEGHVDFIYAHGTAYFDRCHIHCLADGYITAASTPQDVPVGYVFRDCTITAEPTVKRTYLGRPWRPYASVTFINCQLPAQIDPAGWHNWGKAENEKTARYAEYNSTGPGARAGDRVPWSRQLTKEEADKLTVQNILGGKDNWDPTHE